MYISKRLLKKLLNLSNDDDNHDTKNRVSYDTKGPAYFDAWLYFLEGNDNCWQQRELTVLNPPKKKIILSNAFLSEQAPESSDLSLISTLIEHFDVYLWEGDKISLDTLTPIQSSGEFWQIREKMVGASKREIEECIAQQGAMADQYIIVDDVVYRNLIERLNKDFDERDNTFFTWNPAEAVQLEFNSNVKSLWLEDTCLNFNINNFPYLKLLYINQINDFPWKTLHSDNLEALEIYNINLKNFKQSEIPNLKELDILSCDNFSFDAWCLDNLEKLTIGCTDFKDLDISKLPNLKELNIDSCSNFSWNNLHLNNIENLTIESMDLKNFDIGKFAKLKQLKIFNNKNFPWDALYSDSVEKLEIKSSNLKYLDLSKLPKLKELNILSRSNFSCKNLHLDNIERLTIRKANLKDFNKSKLPNLKELNIDSCSNFSWNNLHLNNIEKLTIESMDLKNFDIGKLAKLKQLKISNYENFSWDALYSDSVEKLVIEYSNLKYLDLSKFPKLKELKISNCQNLTQKVLQVDNLKNLLIRYTDLANFSLSHFLHLEELELEVCANLPSHFLHSNSLIKLKINDTYLPDFDSDKLPNLESFYISRSNHNLNSAPLYINLCHSKHLRRLVVKDNNLKFSNLSACQKLVHINLSSENIENINELSELPKKCDIKLQDQYTNTDKNKAINTANLSLSRYNEHSAVSKFTLAKDIRVDSKTGLDNTPKIYTGELTYIVTSSDITASRDKYRIQIIDNVVFKNEDIVFNTTDIRENNLKNTYINTSILDKNKIAELSQAIKGKPQLALGYFKGRMIPGKYYPLAAHHPFRENSLMQLFCNVEKGIELFWHPEHQHYYISLAPHIKDSKEIEIAYEYKRKAFYQAIPAGRIVIQERDHSKALLPPTLKALIKETIDEIPALQALTKKDITNPHACKELLETLIAYCDKRGFKNEDLSKKPQTGIDNLIQLIKEQKGSCRHRSEAFFVLARYFGIPARMVINERHQFCEIAYGDESSIDRNVWRWRALDFGGAPGFDVTPMSERQNVFETSANNGQAPKLEKVSEKPVTNIQAPKSESVLDTPADIAQEPKPVDINNKRADILKLNSQPDLAKQESSLINQTQKKYQKLFANLLQESILNSIMSLINNKDTFSPLIIIKKPYTIFETHQCILNELKQNNFNLDSNDCLYIHCAKDFSLFLHPYRLENGERKQITGPLKKLIKEGGVLVINWANFSPAEIASYKSILDTQPTLLGEDVSPKLTILGLADEQTQSCSAFRSRCTPYYLSESFIQEFKPKVSSNESILKNNIITPIKIDLFHSHGWREKLLGKVKFKGNAVLLEDGALIRAVKENKPIIIYNIPDNDDSLKALLHRFEVERKIFYNGELLCVPAESNLSIQTQSLLTYLNNVNLSSIETIEKKETRQPIYLGIYNLHECIEKLQIGPDSKAYDASGLLKNYDNTTQFFYLTESLLKSDWQMLLETIQKYYSDKKFEFKTAPGVGIENVLEPGILKTNTVPLLNNYSYNIILSNDNDFYCQEFLKENKDTLIVDVTPQTSFTDLMTDISIKKTENSSSVNFNYQEKEVLAALNNGKTVILNGELSSALYQRLLPLLSNSSPYIDCNGKRIESKGKLISVQPDTVQNQLIPFGYSIQNYKLENYLELYSKPEQLEVKKIINFYDLAKKLPHIGPGRPAFPILSFHRLYKMVKALKNAVPLHKNNPLKSLFHFDYPKNSEDYAYLNVSTKCIFGNFINNTNSSNKQAKLKHILDTYNIHTLEDFIKNKEHFWKILNCLSVESLKILFNDSLETFLDPQSGFPMVCSKHLEKIWLATELLKTDSKTRLSQHSHVDKREKQLYTLLADENVCLIILKGAPGTGKSSTVRTMGKNLKFNYYEGEDNIIKWLEDNTDQQAVLNLDEANMRLPGTWDFLKGLSRDKRSVYYKGKFYTLTQRHKIIATGNTENYPGRYYHDFFQHYGNSIEFRMPEYEYIEKTVLKLILPNIDNKYIQLILKAYHLIHEINSVFTYSTRDLENLALRFRALTETPDAPQHYPDILFEVCVSEFAGTIFNTEKRGKFIHALAEKFEITLPASPAEKLLKISSNIYISQKHDYIVKGIIHGFKLREYIIDHSRYNSDSQFKYKRAILIEGESGIGKSKLFKTLLEEKGFSKTHSDTQKKYYEISAGNKSKVEKKLRKAFRNGSVVILDELNLDDSLELLLNQLLTGVDENNNPPDKEGFMVLASQNPGYKGRKAVSAALRNRSNVFYMEPYEKEDLIALAEKAQIKSPDLFVDAYLQNINTPDNSNANMRTFFNALEKEKLEKAKEEKAKEDRAIEIRLIKNRHPIYLGLKKHIKNIREKADNDFKNNSEIKNKLSNLAAEFESYNNAFVNDYYQDSRSDRSQKVLYTKMIAAKNKPEYQCLNSHRGVMKIIEEALLFIGGLIVPYLMGFFTYRLANNLAKIPNPALLEKTATQELIDQSCEFVKKARQR